jgi:cyclophilin family peptidyl-prolyl cis-trans isomerase
MRRFFATLGLFAVFQLRASDLTNGLPDGLYAEVTTPKGAVVAELHYKQAPMTVSHYVGLAEGTIGPNKGKPFYEGLTFHRVVPEFVVQGGDPTGRGNGGVRYRFPDEFVPGLRHDRPGVVQMANSGPDSNGSQWCFMLNEVHRLNYLHSVFGHVIRGLDVLPKIQQGDTMSVKILRVGKAARAFKVTDESFAALTNKAKLYNGPREPGPDALFDDQDKILPSEWSRARGFNFKLANFERATGRKIRSRLLAKTPEGGIETYMSETATRLGVQDSGVLAVYCADTDQWHLKAGKKDSRVLRENAKAKLLAAAKKRTAEAVAFSQKNMTAGQTVSVGQRIKLSTDSVIDELIFKFEPPMKR